MVNRTKEMAGQELDRLSDPLAGDEEQAADPKAVVTLPKLGIRY